MFAYERPLKGYLDDDLTVHAFIRDEANEALVPEADITSVAFTIVVPGDDPLTPTIDAEAGTVAGDGHGSYIVPGATNAVQGNYLGKATFVYEEGADTLTRSVPFEYTIEDPFERTNNGGPEDEAVALAWQKLESCFDSELGGPWLRDMTKARFDHSTVRNLIGEAMLEINHIQPITSFTVASFPYTTNDGNAIMAQGLLVATIRHLMRSYTEQPDVTNSPVAFFDRKRYQQAWSVIYQIELERFQKWLELWKRQFIDMSGAKLIISSRAGRNMQGSMRYRGSLRGF